MGKMRLKPEIFDVEVNPEIVSQVVAAMLANQRRPWAHAKTRGEVRGGGRKPWRQKGTGRARHGSIRSPIWIGGGVTFGPRSERNYRQKINKKVKTKATLMCLTDKAKGGKLIILDELKLDAPKTKVFLQVLKKLPVEGKIMFILPDKDETAERSSGNLPDIKIKTTDNFNVLDLLNSKFLILTKAGVKKIEGKYTNKTEKPKNRKT